MCLTSVRCCTHRVCWVPVLPAMRGISATAAVSALANMAHLYLFGFCWRHRSAVAPGDAHWAEWASGVRSAVSSLPTASYRYPCLLLPVPLPPTGTPASYRYPCLLPVPLPPIGTVSLSLSIQVGYILAHDIHAEYKRFNKFYEWTDAAFTKLHVLRLGALLGFDKVMLLDADTLATG
eukprot:GHVU01131032.1.p1 GENE.GHVU01131032.1~~GHVU01131032.1.p1  ORF type:complete len:178 (+),score=15.52 GHVU01131032.1:817-1350(+)